MSKLRKRGGDTLASLAIVLATLAAVVLALHVVFAIFGANPDNGIVTFVGGLADTLAWQFRDLFLLRRDSLQVLVNFGTAAVIYLVLGRVVAGLLRKLH